MHWAKSKEVIYRILKAFHFCLYGEKPEKSRSDEPSGMSERQQEGCVENELWDDEDQRIS